MTAQGRTGAQVHWLPDGRRLHMNHGPIDLIVEAFGEAQDVQAAYEQAAGRFGSILDELVAELAALRLPSGATRPRRFSGATARRMEAACVPLAERFITPMAAVAGAVADEMLAAMVSGRPLEKAYVNDGGDIAIHLAPGHSIKAAVAGTGRGLGDRLTIGSTSSVRGIATSGWRGRSFSLGIADAVTVLARSAAEADAAATLVANAINLPGHPSIKRQPASALAPDSDLGQRLVTVHVGPLSCAEVAEALEAGLAVADDLHRRGLIEGAALFLGGQSCICGGQQLVRAASEPILQPGASILSDARAVTNRGTDAMRHFQEETHA